MLVDPRPSGEPPAEITRIHRFYAPLRLDGRSNRVKLAVREYSDGSRRHYAVDFVEVGPAMVPGPPIGEATPTGMAGPTIVTLRDLLAGVNRDDGTPVFPAPGGHPGSGDAP